MRLCDDCGDLVDRPPEAPVALCDRCAKVRFKRVISWDSVIASAVADEGVRLQRDLDGRHV